MRAIMKTAALALLGSVLIAPIAAQDTNLLDKQKQATQAFTNLKQRMQKLQLALKASDPDKARLLGLGSTYAREKGIEAKMSEIANLILEGLYDDAIAESKKVVKDLDKLIDLLLKGDTRIEELLEEIERLEAFKDKVEKIIKDQKAEKNESAKAEALKEHAKNIEKAMKAVDELIKDQKQLRKEANQSGLNAEPKKAEKMAGEEGSLKERAKDLAKELEQLEKDAKDLKAGAGEGKDGKPGEPGEGGEGGGQGAPSMGAKSASSAGGSMGDAQKKLQQNQPESSLEDMEKAIKELEDAKKDLKKELEDAKRELQKLPFEKLANKQLETKVETDNLSKEMEKSEGDGEGGAGKPTPGKQQVQQAVPKQKSAAGQLKEYKPGKAKQDQQDAEDKLEEAKKQLEEALAQLRQQLQDEVLRSLEERFGAMLAAQKKITRKTASIDNLAAEALTANGAMPTSLKERAKKEATKEFKLSGEAHDSLKLLEEDGTTAVFPDFVIEVRDDLKAIGQRLAAGKTGKATQAMQKEVEDMLEMLIDALKQQIEQNEQKGGEP